MYVCSCAHTFHGVHIYRGYVIIFGVSCCLLTFWDRISCFPLSMPIYLDHNIQWFLSLHIPSYSRGSGIADKLVLQVYMGCGDLNSNHLTCTLCILHNSTLFHRLQIPLPPLNLIAFQVLNLTLLKDILYYPFMKNIWVHKLWFLKVFKRINCNEIVSFNSEDIKDSTQAT